MRRSSWRAELLRRRAYRGSRWLPALVITTTHVLAPDSCIANVALPIWNLGLGYSAEFGDWCLELSPDARSAVKNRLNQRILRPTLLTHSANGSLSSIG